MDWGSVTFDWNRARAFLVTAEEGSLSAAARALGMAQPTLGRQVSAFEEEMGVVLFERVGRRLILTPSGRALFDHVRGMGQAATRLSLAATGQSRTVEGKISISGTEMFSAYVLPDILTKLRRDHPGIVVEVVATNSLSDLQRREADIAIRHNEPKDPELIAKRFKDGYAKLYASPDYIAREGPFDDAQSALKAAYVGFVDNDALIAGYKGFGLPVTNAHFRILSDGHLVHMEMARRGLGIAVLSTIAAEDDPMLQEVAPWMQPFTYPVWLVAHREVNTSARVRVVFDLLARELAALLAADEECVSAAATDRAS
ncbi:MAG: LysR family transcriptional regulator [Pseudomonadota bacterium]